MFKAILLVMCSCFFILSVINIILFFYSKKWKSVKSILMSVHKGTKRISISLRYQVDYKEYNHYKTFTFYSSVEADSFIKKNNLYGGNLRDVYYNPKNPNSVILDKGFNQFNKYSGQSILFFLITIILLILYCVIGAEIVSLL